jgi:poly(3-hydroxybutyrate) depolymerase
MPLQPSPLEKSDNDQSDAKVPGFVSTFVSSLIPLMALVMIAMVFLPTESSLYALSHSLWYIDFRYWSPWVSYCCWLVFAWAMVSTALKLFLKRPLLYQAIVGVLFVFLIWIVWYKNSALHLTTMFTPIMSPVYSYYVLPLADYYTTGEGRSPAFLPTLFVTLLVIAFIVWRGWYHFKQWKKSKTTNTTTLLLIVPLIGIALITLGADAPVPPQKVATSTGIYDVQSKDDLLKFTAKDIRELVKMEDENIRGNSRTPHPILVYCFEERSFQYTGGKYDNAEIKYRLRVPKKKAFGKKYPLVVHLHGVGEAGRDNTLSLAHLHSILPLIVGPEQQDFYLLVLQCPPDDRHWTFKPTKDGNLDVLVAAMDHAVRNNPIDERRLSAFGLSSGGYGVWQLLTAYPEKFAAAVPASCSVPWSQAKISLLSDMPIWTFKNANDDGADTNSISQAMRIINGSGGYMKLTQFAQGGHAAWRPAMDEYNCFSWMIAQKRGGWFNPPPEREFYQSRSLFNCFFAFILPLGLTAGLLVFQRSPSSYEHLLQAIVGKCYPLQYNQEEETVGDYQGDEIEPTADNFRIWTDITGTKKLNAKIVDFQGSDQVRIQLSQGKTMTAQIKQFCDADQAFMMQIRSQMSELSELTVFRKWTDITGERTTVAKFAGFQSDNMVLLQSKAGQTIPIPIDRLGKAEQEFLAKLKR